MVVTRRAFLKLSGTVMAGTAVGALAGLGADLRPKVARAQEIRIKNARTYPSVCCYCSVGCGLLVHDVDGTIVNIEGNPTSPINYGNLCPKGAAVYQLHVNPNRLTKILHRAPGAREWEVWDLDRAMDRVAELVKKTRDETFVETVMSVPLVPTLVELVKKTRDETFVETLPNGKRVMMTPAIFSLGGALLDDEWNHIHQKLMRGLGIVAIENQARI